MMKRTTIITTLFVAFLMMFAMMPPAAGKAHANSDNETTGTEKTIILDPGTATGDLITVKSTDEGAMAESEEEAANGQFYVKEDVMYYKLPDPPNTFAAPAGVDCKGWIQYHMIQWKHNTGEAVAFRQDEDSLTLTAVWGPSDVNVNPYDNLVCSFNDENLTATIVGYGTTDLDPLISIPYSVNQGGDTPQCTITGIDDYAFQYLKPMFSLDLYPLYIPSGVRFIGDYAFYDTDCFNGVVFESDTGESQLERIGNYAFANCTECTSVEIPASVKTIGENAFADCDYLKNAVYQGTKEQWDKVSVGAGNEDLTDVLTFQPTQIKNVVLSKSSYTYNGKVQKPAIKTICGKTLKEGTDYTAKWSNKSSKNAGTYSVTVTGKGDYVGTGTAKYTIAKAANTLKIKPKTATVKYSKVREKAQTLGVAKVINFTSKGQGTKTYVKKSGNKKITINKKTGKVTLKKGLKKGTYKVTVKVKATGNTNYKPSTEKTVTFKVKVFAPTPTTKLSKKYVTICKGTSYKLKLTGTKASEVKWKSKNSRVAKVKKGKITAVKKGTTYITAKYKGKTYKCKVVVMTKNSLDQKISAAQGWHCENIWNSGFCDISHYIEEGTDSVGEKMDINKTITRLDKSWKNYPKWNTFVESVVGSRYSKFKSAWKNARKESEKLKQMLDKKGTPKPKSNYYFPSEKLSDYVWDMFGALPELN